MSSKECETQLNELLEAWDLDEATLNQTDIEAIKHLLLENQMQQDEIVKLRNRINTYENPEDLTLMFMYCDEKAKDKIKELKDKLKGVQEERDYLFNKTSVENKYLQQDRDKYKEVIEEVREYIEDWLFNAGGNGASMNYEDINELLQILDKVKD